MPKRGYSGTSLTGGTGDVNPQWFRMTDTNPAATPAYADTPVALPIQRLPTAGKAQVIEILKVAWGLAAVNSAINDAATDSVFCGYLTTRSYGTTEPTSATGGGVIDYFQIDVTTATQASIMNNVFPIIHDLTDGAGHGVIVGTDQMFLGSVQTADTNPIAGLIRCWFLYRFKNVPVTEYIGIVQSQTQ